MANLDLLVLSALVLGGVGAVGSLVLRDWFGALTGVAVVLLSISLLGIAK